jgi:hypothetical protein
MSQEQINSLIKWLNEAQKAAPYGEINIKIITHEGKLKRVEKAIIIKELFSNE